MLGLAMSEPFFKDAVRLKNTATSAAWAVMLWSILMSASLRGLPPRPADPTYSGPILAVELPASDKALRWALGETEKPEMQQKIQSKIRYNTDLDMFLIIWYTT